MTTVRTFQIDGPYTTAERDALINVTTGMVIYNSTRGTLDRYNGSFWISIVGPTVASYAPGSLIITDGQYLLQPKRLRVSGAEKLRLEGTAECILFDLPSTASGMVLAGRGN